MIFLNNSYFPENFNFPKNIYFNLKSQFFPKIFFILLKMLSFLINSNHKNIKISLINPRDLLCSDCD